MLLVDDDASLRRALGRALRLAGFDVEMLPTAEALLARGVDERDRCLVLDIDLPAMDGIACKRRLDAIGRMGGHGYATTRDYFDLPTMSVADWRGDRSKARRTRPDRR